MSNASPRVAVVTGAAQGIGRRTAQLLAERGHAVALADLRSPDEALAEIRAIGVEAMAVVGDLADEQAVLGLAAEVDERWGRADVLVNNAGISLIAPAEDDLRRRLPPRARGESRRAVPARPGLRLEDARGAGRGSIINVASIAGLVGSRRSRRL